MNVYIVKSGIMNDFDIQWLNLKAFKTLTDAKVFAAEVEKQIHPDNLDETEFVYIDELTLA